MTEVPSDEKICPICGRPNLKKATKCWYCQSPLDSEEQHEQQGSLISGAANIQARADRTSFVKSTIERHEDDKIPEWLKRIRELKASGEQADDNKDRWQQQHLFKNYHRKNKKIAKSQSKSGTEKPKKTKIKAKYRYHPIVKKAAQKKISPTNLSSPYKGKHKGNPEGLPDGFVDFSTDKDDNIVK